MCPHFCSFFVYVYASFSSIRRISVGLILSQRCEFGLGPLQTYTKQCIHPSPRATDVSYKWTIVRWSAWDVPTANFLSSPSGIVAEELLSTYDTHYKKKDPGPLGTVQVNKGHGNGGRYGIHRTKFNYCMHSSSSVMFRLSHKEKWSSEPRWICWASVCFSK